MTRTGRAIQAHQVAVSAIIVLHAVVVSEYMYDSEVSTA